MSKGGWTAEELKADLPKTGNFFFKSEILSFTDIISKNKDKMWKESSLYIILFTNVPSKNNSE